MMLVLVGTAAAAERKWSSLGSGRRSTGGQTAPGAGRRRSSGRREGDDGFRRSFRRSFRFDPGQWLKMFC